MGDVANRSTLREMDDGDGGGTSMLDSRFGGVAGEKMSLSKEDEAEK